VIDLREGSATRGAAISTPPTGLNASMPHHMEYTMPPAGEWLFLNAPHPEASLLVDVSNPLALRIAKTFAPPAPLRYPHDYTRTPTGTRLVGFLRSNGTGIDPTETVTPGNHGGIAEYRADGTLLRTAIAGDANGKPVRPYAFALLPKRHRCGRAATRDILRARHAGAGLRCRFDSRCLRDSRGVRTRLDQSGE
jgi:hypothetical protein